jgi:tetratricopeptide (TPR) repeat protein
MAKNGKMSPRLSVVMIVRDAEDCLANTLDSINAIADEVVVIDAGSTDGTVRLAQQKATRVASVPWTDSFAAARNAALLYATGDWIFWLDAGETLSQETALTLRQFVDTQAEKNTAYYLIIKIPQQGTDIAAEQVARIRLHPRLPGLEFTGRVRETLLDAVEKLDLKTEGLSFVIQRGAREHLPAIKEYRAQRNMQLASMELQEAGPRADLLNCLGEAAQWLGDHQASANFYRQAVELSTRGSSEMLEAYYGLLTSLEGFEASRDSQLQLCMAALEIYPLDAQLLCAIGGYLQSREQLELASRAYQLAAEHGQINLQISHLDGLQEIAVNCYAMTLQLLGRESEAITLLERELAEAPNSARLRRQLLDLHVKHGNREEALAVVNAMPRNIPNREALRGAVRGACLAATGNWVTAKSHLETAYKAGCRDAICLRWLTALHLAMGHQEQAAATLQEWARLEPLSAEMRQYRASMNITPSEHPPEPKRAVRVDDSPSPVAPKAIDAAGNPIHGAKRNSK